MASQPRKPGDEGLWAVNGGDHPLVLDVDGQRAEFEANQRFRLIEVGADSPNRRAGKYRITTLAYAYNLTVNGEAKLAWRWHPNGNSFEARPHIHLPGSRAHLPGPRHTLEEVIEGIISLGAVPACADWRERLMESDGIHKLYRSWVDDPERRTQ